MAALFEPNTISDPRLDQDFDAGFLPFCDGAEPPPLNTTDRHERRKIQFLAVYYRLNQLYRRLESIREGMLAGDEQRTLMEIQRAIRRRDELEDFYQAEGFLGEPVMEGIFYKNIEFTYAHKREFYPLKTSARAFDIFVPMPPQGVDMEAWVREHLSKAFPQYIAGIISTQKRPGALTDPSGDKQA